MKARQRGVALITAVLIVAIVATLATSLALGQQVWLRQTQNLTDLAQAERLRQGAIEFAAAIVARDAKNNQTGSVDHLGEDWAKAIPPLPVEGGVVGISIADAQGRFNLNNLHPTNPNAANPGAGGSANQGDVQVYRRLLAALDLDPALVEPLQDWLDGDRITRPGGAEDLDYLNHDPPYRAANRELTSVDELRLVKGYTPEVIDILRPYVVALPSPAAINVNTAPDIVLAALLPSGDRAVADLVRTRETNPFKDPAAFGALTGATNITGSYATTTRYFIVSVETRIGRTHRLTEALIERRGGNNVQTWWYRLPALKIVLDEDKA